MVIYPKGPGRTGFSKWFPERGRKPNFYNFWVLKLRPADFLNDSPKGDGNLKGTSWVHGHDRTPFSKWFPERGRKHNKKPPLTPLQSFFYHFLNDSPKGDGNTLYAVQVHFPVFKLFSKWFPERGRKPQTTRFSKEFVKTIWFSKWFPERGRKHLKHSLFQNKI